MSGLLEQQATRRSFVIAGSVAAVLILASVLAAPFASAPVAAVPPFLPIFATAVVILEGLTAYLLATLFFATRSPFPALLAAAYAFVAVMAGIQLLISPGVFSATGLLGAGPQSAVWLWALWHGGYPFLVLLGLISITPRYATGREEGWQLAAQLLMFAAPITAVLLAYLATAGGGLLPPLIDGVSYTTLSQSPVATVIITTNLLALFWCVAVTRLRQLLSLWLAVALLASLADASLTLMGGARFSLGWYLARVLSLISSSVVLAVLIWEISVLYRQVAAANVQLADRVRRDGLTGAFNRVHLDEQGAIDFKLAKRSRNMLSVLMIDADHFKAYNDSMGHLMGDRCLIALVEAINGVLRRPSDYLVRYGGEEFAVVLPKTDPQGAIHMAHAVRAAVADRKLERKDGFSPFVTISVGVATSTPNQDIPDLQALIHQADQALYRAKAAGRDTLKVYGAPSDSKPAIIKIADRN